MSDCEAEDSQITRTLAANWRHGHEGSQGKSWEHNLIISITISATTKAELLVCPSATGLKMLAEYL